ncbi:hypothetical protein HYO29_22500 [Vibrio parahaemolyticus]|nr:hypothetical protein [Vibrio parahaemolyticus]
MKLFVEEKIGGRKTGKKLFLDKVAPTKRELQDLLGSKDFFINNERYYVNQVQAQKSSDNTAMGMVLGGVLGLIGGAAGVAAGGTIGGLLGKDSDIKEQERVDKFNGSKL